MQQVSNIWVNGVSIERQTTYPVKKSHLIGVNTLSVSPFAIRNPEDNLLVLNQGDKEDQNEGNPDRHGNLAVAPEKPMLKRPSLFKVVMLNDDFTPMDFVVEVLMAFFDMHESKATQVMLAVHTQGKAICGIFTRDIAESKAAQVNQYASECDHPLMCEIERAD